MISFSKLTKPVLGYEKNNLHKQHRMFKLEPYERRGTVVIC